jgi:hypothetical protein
LSGLKANEIDKLNSREDVVRFLVKRVNKDYDSVFAGSRGEDSGSLAGQFFKLDIDGNGHTDLIVNGRSFLIVMDRGNEEYKEYPLDRERYPFFGAILGGLDTAGGNVKLIVWIRHPEMHILNVHPEYVEKDTLVWWKGGFIEYNPTPIADFRFERISVSTSRCFGKCPVFKMRVNADGSAEYEAILYNDKSGTFVGKVRKEGLKAMADLLGYLALDRLNGQYNEDWTDDQTIDIEIVYNGRAKKVSDYALCGTYGLKRLYPFFFNWRKEVKWKEK